MSYRPHTTLRRFGFRVSVSMAALLFALSGCAEIPIKKTNCWSKAPAPASASVNRNATSPLMLISALDAVPPKHDAVCV